MIEVSKIQADAEELMQSAILFLDDALAHIRAGKASARILDPIRVDYYGAPSPPSPPLMLAPSRFSRGRRRCSAR